MVLKDAGGKFFQDYKLRIDPTRPSHRACLDLNGYLYSHSSLDNHIADQLRLIDEVSAWIGSEVLGKVAEKLAQYSKPVTVCVRVPPEAHP